LQAPNAAADNNVRGALAYIQQNNLSADENKALEAQYGIWQLRGATGSPAGGDVAKAVVNAGNTPPAAPQGTSLLDAAKAEQIRLTLGTWGPIGNPVPIGSASDNFYGRGNLTVENTSQQALTLYTPIGMLFPPNTAGEQTMAAYSTNTQVSNPQQSVQQPNQLPNTGAGDTSPSWLFMVAAAGLLLGGSLLRLRAARR
jgi:LPXTG-motif cell wall-anchored protein